MTPRERFARDGYFVVRELLSPAECQALLSRTVASFGESASSYVHASSLRRHQPLALTPEVRRAVCRLAEGADGLLHQALETSRSLAELSSITVFPGAAAQKLHRDESTEDRPLISVFVNLAPTTAEAGALVVRPGSHRVPFTPGDAPLALELPQGSAVYMSSKLLHAGGANVTTQQVRPVFYASFGALDITGPVYSIRDDLRGRYTLEHFLPRAFAPGELVTLAKGVRLLRGVAGDGPVLLAREAAQGLVISEQLDVDDPARLEVLRQLSRGPVQAGELPADCGGFLSQLWLAGCIEPTSLAALVGLG